VEGGESSNLLGAFLPCSQQSASINKGLAVPRSILIFKLTAERIRAFVLPLAIGRERKRGGRIHPRSHTRSSVCPSPSRVYVHARVRSRACVCIRSRSRLPPRGRVYTHSDRNSDRHRTAGCRYTWNLIINKCERG